MKINKLKNNFAIRRRSLRLREIFKIFVTKEIKGDYLKIIQ